MRSWLQFVPLLAATLHCPITHHDKYRTTIFIKSLAFGQRAWVHVIFVYMDTSVLLQSYSASTGRLFLCHRLLWRHKCESRQTRTEGNFAKWHELYRSNPLIHLINICYLSLSVTSWERWTWTNTGHFSVSYELSVNVTQVKTNTGV